MNIRKIAAAAAFATGAALASAPLASADTSSDWWSTIDGLLSGASPAATSASDFQISFNGMDLFPTTGNLATATTVEGQYGFALAYGNGASATAEGGTSNVAIASGTNALANAGSLTHATGYNFNFAEDIGNNTAGGPGAHDGAYAGGGSLIGAADSATASSNNSAIDIGNNGPTTGADPVGGNTGAFAGDGNLIGLNAASGGNSDTAYTFGNILGENDGAAAVNGDKNYSLASGTENGSNEGAFAGIGNSNTAIADANYTTDHDGARAIGGDGNIAYIDGPNNSNAFAGGPSTTDYAGSTEVGNNNTAFIDDPFGTTADTANAGSTSMTPGSNDLADVFLTHGNASATGGNTLYDIISLFGNYHSASLPAAADAAAAPTSITSTVASEVALANSQFQTDAFFAGVPSTDYSVGPQGFDVINMADITKDAPASGTPSILDYELFGVAPFKAGVAGDPGAFNLFNGAEARFDDAYNVALYAFLNNGALDPNTGTDFFGSLPTGFATDTATQAFDAFYNNGIGDLSGFFQVPLTFLDIPTGM